MEWTNLQTWEDRSLDEQRAEYDKQALAWEAREGAKDWLRVYTRMTRALIEEFEEEVVLDTFEKVWWDLQYEGGKTFREDFDSDLPGMFQSMFARWHLTGAQSLTSGVYDVELEDERWHLLMLYCKQKEVALEMDARKIIIGQCMGDCAAVRGWSPHLVMRFPNAQLRGNPYCYQIREIVADADPDEDHWSVEKSRRYGWRSIKELEEA